MYIVMSRYVCPILGIKKILERSQSTRPKENVMTENSRNFQQNVTNGESESPPSVKKSRSCDGKLLPGT